MSFQAPKKPAAIGRPAATGVFQQKPQELFVDSRSEALKMQEIQDTANNSARSLKLKALYDMTSRKPSQPTPSTASVAQRMTYAMRYPGEPDASYEDIVKDATTISTKEKGGLPLIKHGEAWGDKTAAQQKFVHIVAHGNAAEVAGLGPSKLLDHIKELGLDLKLCERIKLHSCDSGVVDERVPPDTKTIYVNRLANLLPRGLRLKVFGMKGHSFTNNDGQSRVLKDSKDPEVESEYRKARDRMLKRKESVAEIDDKYLLSAAESELEGKAESDEERAMAMSMALIEEGRRTGCYPPLRRGDGRELKTK